MKAPHTSFYPGLSYQKGSQEKLTLLEALKIYFTILAGVLFFVLSFYHL